MTKNKQTNKLNFLSILQQQPSLGRDSISKSDFKKKKKNTSMMQIFCENKHLSIIEIFNSYIRMFLIWKFLKL